MTDGQSYIVGPWTLNLCFSKAPVSFSIQVSLSLPFIHLSVILPSPSSLPPLFQPLVFSFPFDFLSPSLSFFSSIYLSPPQYHDLFLSALLWYFHLCLMLAFSSLHSLFSSRSFTFTLSWIHHLFSLHIHRSFIHYFPLFTLCPPLILFFKIHWCFLSFMDIPLFHSTFIPLIHASIRGTCFNSQCSPGSASRGLSTLTFKGYQCSVYLDMFCSKTKPFESSRDLSVYLWTLRDEMQC